MHAASPFGFSERAIMLINTYLFLQLFLGEHLQLVAKYLLRIQNFLIVHFAHKTLVLDAIGFQEFHIGNLKGLTNGLGNKLGL